MSDLGPYLPDIKRIITEVLNLPNFSKEKLTKSGASTNLAKTFHLMQIW